MTHLRRNFTTCSVLIFIMYCSFSTLSVHAQQAADVQVQDHALALLWAPIHYQDVDRTGRDALGGKSDYLTAVDYDGDWDASNNWESLPKHDAKATVYYSVTATQDYWFIIYAFYHPRDWLNDAPYPKGAIGDALYREATKQGAHENDLEGMLVIVQRPAAAAVEKDGKLLGVVTVFHNDFYAYSPKESPLRDGAKEDIDGEVRFEKDGDTQRFVSAQEASGHGIKIWPQIKLEPKDQPDGIRYLPSIDGKAEVPEHPDDREVRYRLVSIFEKGQLWDRRNEKKLFSKYGVFNGNGKNLKRDAAHAPWKWDDHNDGRSLPGGELATDPLKLCAVYFSKWPVPLKTQSYVQNNYTANHARADDSGVDPLQTAKALETGDFAGYIYGTSKDRRDSGNKKRIDCTEFLLAVVSKIAVDRSVNDRLTSDIRAKITIANLNKEDAARLQSLVDDEDIKIRGIQTALVDAKLGNAVSAENAKPGDLVQYWYKERGQWRGHAGIIEKIDETGLATIYGAHRSTLQRERGKEEKKGGIGSGPRFKLTDTSRQIFVVRWSQG